jgi:hypothetical protein
LEQGCTYPAQNPAESSADAQNIVFTASTVWICARFSHLHQLKQIFALLFPQSFEAMKHCMLWLAAAASLAAADM